MALEKLGTNASWGIAFLVSAGIVAEIVAKACSSPQTAHLNAGTRAPTLMLWVNVGMVESAGFVIVAALMDKKHATAFLAGGLAEGLITYGEYMYAKKTGLENPGTPTEQPYSMETY